MRRFSYGSLLQDELIVLIFIILVILCSKVHLIIVE